MHFRRVAYDLSCDKKKKMVKYVFIVPLKLGLSPSFKNWCLFVPQLLKYIVHGLCMPLKGLGTKTQLQAKNDISKVGRENTLLFNGGGGMSLRSLW